MENKRNQGITLVALVVTVIVLLILSGISISMLSGESGILNKVAEAKSKTDMAQKEELDKMVKIEAMTQVVDTPVTNPKSYGTNPNDLYD